MIKEDTLIFDIESKTFGRPDPEKDILRVFGAYSYKTKKHYFLKTKEDIQKLIDNHKAVVGYNIKKYDIPVCKRFGIKFDFKYQIDLMDIIIKRAPAMKIKKGMLGDLLMRHSLDFVTKLLDLVTEEEGKMTDFDYNILKKDIWTPEETKLILDYTRRDIDITKKLYEWLEKYFEPFKDFVIQKDVDNKQYLTCSTASFAYKAICKALKWPEKYNDSARFGGAANSIQGGYVAYPAGERFSNEDGPISCEDYNSLYPSIMIQANLYGRVKDPFKEGWTGFGSEGKYDNKKLAGVGQLLYDFYLQRAWYKLTCLYKKDEKEDMIKFKDIKLGDEIYYVDLKTYVTVDEKYYNNIQVLLKKGVDAREYSIKIVINTAYGILNNPLFELVYDPIAGGDCTRLGRTFVKMLRKKFHNAGYKVLATDTDSVYIQDPFNDRGKIEKLKNEHIAELQAKLPFPIPTFKLGLDDEIKYMFFFKGTSTEEKATDDEMDELDFINKPLGLMKKNYIYVTTDNKLKVKNLGVRKKSISALGREIFWEYLVPRIKEEGQVKFSKTYFLNLINELLSKDIKKAAIRYQVHAANTYKSKTGIQAQIAEMYGPGIHFLIPNLKNIGVGKGKRYCTIKEFNERELNISHINLQNVWKELTHFIKPVKTKSIFDY